MIMIQFSKFGDILFTKSKFPFVGQAQSVKTNIASIGLLWLNFLLIWFWIGKQNDLGNYIAIFSLFEIRQERIIIPSWEIVLIECNSTCNIYFST